MSTIARKSRFSDKKRTLALFGITSVKYAVDLNPTLSINISVYIQRINLEPINSSEFYRTVRDSRDKDRERYFSYFRVSPALFDKRFGLIRSRLQHKPNHFFPISSKESLSLALQLLATRAGPKNLATRFYMGISTVAVIVKQVCEVLWVVRNPLFMPVPTEKGWKSHAHAFYKKMEFSSLLWCNR